MVYPLFGMFTKIDYDYVPTISLTFRIFLTLTLYR